GAPSGRLRGGSAEVAHRQDPAPRGERRAAGTIGRMGYIIAIDQGTTSSRAIVFDSAGSVVSVGQKEHEQLLPRAGWVEHDPMEIWANVREVIGQALSRANLTRHDIEAIGITN